MIVTNPTTGVEYKFDFSPEHYWVEINGIKVSIELFEDLTLKDREPRGPFMFEYDEKNNMTVITKINQEAALP